MTRMSQPQNLQVVDKEDKVNKVRTQQKVQIIQIILQIQERVMINEVEKLELASHSS